MANLNLIDPLVMDFNNDGVVDQADVDYAANHINEATALMVNRYVNPPDLEYHMTPSGEVDPDVPPWSQHWMNFNASPGNSLSVGDFQMAQQQGVPIEILWHIFEVISSPLPASIKEQQYIAWKELALSGNNPALSWYPIQQHNPKLPYSSVEADAVPPPGSNPSQEEAPIPHDGMHPLDFDNDGFVNVSDIQLAAQWYGPEVAAMVVRKVTGEGKTYDITGDGNVGIQDCVAAASLHAQGKCPIHIVEHIQQQVMNPPPPTQEYDAEAPVADDGSAYHPLDGNQDGQVSILDCVYWGSRDDLSQQVKTIIINMCMKYMDDSSLCPYDVNGDGQISILDVTMCAQAGVPENILHDIAENIGAQCAPPTPPPVAPPPPEPGPTILTRNLWMPANSWGLLNGTPYFGPVHKLSNNLSHMYLTEYVPKNHSRVLIPLVENPEEALTELPTGQIVPVGEMGIQSNVNPSDYGFTEGLTDLNGDGTINILDQMQLIQQQNQNSGFTPGLTDLNNDGIVDILDQVLQNQQNSGGGNSTGGSGNNNNNQNNSGGGSGGGGGAY